MPTSPTSPSRRRRNPSLDLSSASPGTFATNGYGQSPLRTPQSPRTPMPQSPTTPRQRNRISRSSADFTPHPDGGGGGLGNLADELANAWDEEGEGEEEVDVSGFQDGNDTELSEQISAEGEGDNGSPNSRYSGRRGSEDENGMLHPPKQKPKTAHRRQESKYDGSDYGNDSDLEEPGDISPSLEARISGIESLVRWGTGDSAAPSDELVSRVINGLRDLGGQSGIENGATRLITAHASLTSHLTHQTRTLQTLTHPLLFSPFPTLSADDIDDLIPLIDNVLPTLPFPVSQTHLSPQPEAPLADPLASLQTLLSQTSELTHVLRALGDTIHESRQLTSTASRRLKSVRELVADMRREEEQREEGTRWIEKGEWDRRLGEREAGRVCGDVVSGFEAVCGEWRARLFGAEVAAA